MRHFFSFGFGPSSDVFVQNASNKDKMDQKCSNKNTVEKEGQQSINQPILFISDNTESRHTNIYTDGNIGFLQTNTEQSFLDQGCQKKHKMENQKITIGSLNIHFLYRM
jgi:hypothetical protein